MIYTKISPNCSDESIRSNSTTTTTTNSSNTSNKKTKDFTQIRKKRVPKLVPISIKSPPPPPPDLQMIRKKSNEDINSLRTIENRKSRIIDLGILKVDPNEYKELYYDNIKDTKELPKIAKEIKPPRGLVFAADYPVKPPILEGDIHALKFLNLEAAGLTEYKGYKIFDEIFFTAKRRLDGYVFLYDLERMLLIMNSRYNKSYGYQDAVDFFAKHDPNERGCIEFNEFKEAFLRHFLM